MVENIIHRRTDLKYLVFFCKRIQETFYRIISVLAKVQLVCSIYHRFVCYHTIISTYEIIIFLYIKIIHINNLCFLFTYRIQR